MQHPPATHTPRHARHDQQRGGYGRALEVLGLAGRVLGQRRHGNVEAREARQAAEDEEGEEQRVEWGAEAEGEGGAGGRDAE